MSNFNNVYITRVSTFFPNNPIGNNQIEEILGYAGNKPSRSKNIILRSNGIKNRFYSLNEEGKFIYSNAQLVANAVNNLFDDTLTIDKLRVLACGTSSPDMLLPSLASMVHGELKVGGLDIISTAGACCTGMQALKYAYYSVLTGESAVSVATGSERVSQYLQGSKFDAEIDSLRQLEENPILAFEKDFLRWMLSDGAGAFLLRGQPEPDKINFRIEWIEIGSFANELETCMYLGAEKGSNGEMLSFGEMKPEEWMTKSVFSYKQDIRMLGENVVPVGIRFLKNIIDKKSLDVNEIDYFLPHLSSMFFWNKIVEELKNMEIDIPESKWYINLPQVGNIGAASAYAMLEGLNREIKLETGQKVLLFVPESARFSYSLVYLTVV
ncbi:MAG: beta-ketoacyl-ACP synthase III [Saprospiraceae bacterium]|nr:beta-ketoacyl-ACP synthase III [Saprospiraceae bacterium]